jgi:uncharacterized membrane protein YccC
MLGRFRFANAVRVGPFPAPADIWSRLRRLLAELGSRRVGRPSWRWRTYRGRGVPDSWWRALRSTIAAVLAYEVARQLLPGPAPLLAPLTCLLVAQVTVFETLRSSWQRVGSVTAGVLVAVLLSNVVGLTWWGLGLVILASLVLSVFLHLGEHQLEVPISAMLVLAVTGGTEAAALSRIVETFIGAVIGVAVGTLLAPPVYVRPAAEEIGDLADDLAELLATMGEELTESWSVGQAKAWLERTKELDRSLREAEEALNRGETSLRLNPRGRHLQEGTSSLRAGLSALEHVSVQVKAICRDLADFAEVIEERGGPEPEVLIALGRLLVELGECTRAFGQIVAPGAEGPPQEAVPLRIAMEIARTHRDVFAELMGVDFRADPDLWHIQGALLADVDRMLREMDLERGPDARNVRFR